MPQKRSKSSPRVRRSSRRRSGDTPHAKFIFDPDSALGDVTALINFDPVTLSPEQILFCQEYIASNYNKSEAVRMTFGELVATFSISQVDTLANELLKLPKIKSYIMDELERRAEKLKASADWIAYKYKTWASICITDYIEIEYYTNPRTGVKKPSLKLKTEIEDLPPEIKSAIKSITVNSQGDLKIEFIDQKSALDSLTRMLGLNGDNKIVLDSRAPINVIFDSQDEDA